MYILYFIFILNFCRIDSFAVGKKSMKLSKKKFAKYLQDNFFKRNALLMTVRKLFTRIKKTCLSENKKKISKFRNLYAWT